MSVWNLKGSENQNFSNNCKQSEKQTEQMFSRNDEHI